MKQVILSIDATGALVDDNGSYVMSTFTQGGFEAKEYKDIDMGKRVDQALELKEAGFDSRSILKILDKDE